MSIFRHYLFNWYHILPQILIPPPLNQGPSQLSDDNVTAKRGPGRPPKKRVDNGLTPAVNCNNQPTNGNSKSSKRKANTLSPSSQFSSQNAKKSQIPLRNNSNVNNLNSYNGYNSFAAQANNLDSYIGYNPYAAQSNIYNVNQNHTAQPNQYYQQSKNLREARAQVDR